MLKFIFDSKNRNFLRLWLAQLISQFGDRINQLAIVGLVAERAPDSPSQLAKLLAFTIIPVFIIQPFAGVLVDRWDRRTTLFVCDIIRGILVLTIPLYFIRWDSMVPIYAVIFLIFCFSRFYVPAKMSILPDIVAEQNLLMANSLVTTTGMIAFVLGCALGGFLIDWYGAHDGFMIDAGTFFISGAIIFSISLTKRLKITKSKIQQAPYEIAKAVKKSVWIEIKEAFEYLSQHKDIRFIIYIMFILLAAAGSIYVVIIVFVQQSFHSITKDLGVLAVCLGVGLFSGAIGYGRWGKDIPWYKTIFSCLISGGAMLILFAVVVHYFASFAAAMILAVGLGIAIGPIFIASNTIVHLVSDENMRGKVFSAMEIVIHFAFLVSMLLSSYLAEFVPRIWILVGVGCVFTLVGVMGLVKTKREGPLAFVPQKMV